MNLNVESTSEKNPELNFDFLSSTRIVSKSDLEFTEPSLTFISYELGTAMLGAYITNTCGIPCVIYTPNLTFRLRKIFFDSFQREYIAYYKAKYDFNQKLNKYGL